MIVSGSLRSISEESIKMKTERSFSYGNYEAALVAGSQ